MRAEPLGKALVCELVVAMADGAVREDLPALSGLMAGKSPRRVGPDLLSPALHEWLQQRDPSVGAPLEFYDLGANFSVVLCRGSGRRWSVLLREAPTQDFPRTLQTLGLTKREAEVMRWVCEAKTNPEIAIILGVTVHTVNRHMEHILRKLGVENRQQAVLAVMSKAEESQGIGRTANDACRAPSYATPEGKTRLGDFLAVHDGW